MCARDLLVLTVPESNSNVNYKKMENKEPQPNKKPLNRSQMAILQVMKKREEAKKKKEPNK